MGVVYGILLGVFGIGGGVLFVFIILIFLFFKLGILFLIKRVYLKCMNI